MQINFWLPIIYLCALNMFARKLCNSKQNPKAILKHFILESKQKKGKHFHDFHSYILFCLKVQIIATITFFLRILLMKLKFEILNQARLCLLMLKNVM